MTSIPNLNAVLNLGVVLTFPWTDLYRSVPALLVITAIVGGIKVLYRFPPPIALPMPLSQKAGSAAVRFLGFSGTSWGPHRSSLRPHLARLALCNLLISNSLSCKRCFDRFSAARENGTPASREDGEAALPPKDKPATDLGLILLPAYQRGTSYPGFSLRCDVFRSTSQCWIVLQRRFKGQLSRR